MLIVEFELGRGYSGDCMHLPDPSYVAFGTAVVALATAITGLARLLLEKKPGNESTCFQKKSNSVPRGTRNSLKQKGNHYTTGSPVFTSVS